MVERSALRRSPGRTTRAANSSGGGSAAEAQRHGWRVPPGHMPPPGLCRVWLPDRPPGHQPPPTSCRRAERLADRYGGRVVYGDRAWRDRWDDDRWVDDRRRWRDRDDD